MICSQNALILFLLSLCCLVLAGNKPIYAQSNITGINSDSGQPLNLGAGGYVYITITTAGIVQMGDYTGVPTLQLAGYRPNQWSANLLIFGDELNPWRYFMNTRGTNENGNADWQFYYYNTG